MKAEGEFALVKETLENAMGLTGQPVKRGSMAHDHDLVMILADTAAQLGDAVALREYAPRLEELATRDHHKLYHAVAHRAWGVAHRLASEYAQAQMRFDQALELFGSLEMRWQIGRTFFEMAELDAARADNATARTHLAQALAAFEVQKATPDMERTRTALQAIESAAIRN